MRFRKALLHLMAGGMSFCCLSGFAMADVITFGGQITQSTVDGTGPAVNNLALNLITDGDLYSVTINFVGSINSPSLKPYSLTGASLILQDTTHPASETSFGSISLSVSANGGFDDLSLFACLTTGSSCGASNQLTANFRIPAIGLNGQNVAA